ncbi:MAG: hypothetical protein IGS03_18910 [Candidatus Sericytochromatia bacterium]|nr:hypothetical protein [Candidatus Sericytochromatia bacterium]
MEPLKTGAPAIASQSVQRSLNAAERPAVPVQAQPASAPATASDQFQKRPVQVGQASQALAFVEDTPTDPPSQNEIRWALDLERQSQQGHTPTAAEIRRYEALASRLQNAGSDRIQTTERPTAAQIEQALALETRVKQGHVPSPEERQQYQQVLQALWQADRVAVLPGLSPEESQWALAFQQKVQQGRQATPVEMEHYTQLYARMQQATVSHAPPSAEELDWAQQLSQKMDQGYQASAREAEAYADIYQRYQAQQAPQPGTRTLSSAELNWAVQLRQQINQGYQPSQAEVDRYTDIMRCLDSHQAPTADPARQSLSQYELDWAITLQERVIQGYQPSEAESQRYQTIYQRVTR